MSNENQAPVNETAEDIGQIGELQIMMFEQMKRLNDPALDLEKELRRSNAMKDLGTVIVNSAKAQIDFVRTKNMIDGRRNGNKKNLLKG